MSLSSDFWVNVKKKETKKTVSTSAKASTNTKKKKKKTGNSLSDEFWAAVDDDIAPVSNSNIVPNRVPNRVSDRITIDIAPTKREENKWFQKGAFDDGYQFGDVTKTILGTASDVAENVGSGIMGMGEKVVDALAMIAPYAEQAQFLQNGGYYNPELQKQHDKVVEQSKKDMQKFVAKDLYDEEKIAKKIIGGVTFGYDYESDSVLGEKSDSVIQSGGQLLGTLGLQAVGVPWFLTTGATSFGSEAENAVNQNASYEEAVLSSTIAAGAEILTEKLSGGIKFGGKALDDVLTQQIARGVSNKFVRNAAKLGLDMFGEGAEEWITEDINKFGQWLTYRDEEELKELLFSEEAMDEKIDAFIGGAMLGGVSNAGNAIKSNLEGVDYASGLTNNEEKVVRKVYEDLVAEAEKNGKVTQKQKSKIYDDVLNKMEKGYISTDTIEEVLGGDTYNTYKSTAAYEDNILKEFEELGNKQNPTLSEQHRYSELVQQVKDIKANTKRNELKSQLSDEVFGLVNGSRLTESYNEKARKGQAFDADLSKYDSKQQKTIQNAIDSGILNNTNRTHEMVDMIAKISADKGVLFDFSNNEKIKETGFAVEGKIVNGYKTDSGITLNMDSPKYLESTVGHEITHVLEGTEFYDSLKKTIFEYAKSKGEYDSRMASLTELYKGIKDADIEGELTADLVGDYLFQDADFVNHLSTANRNVFQKIYDEIKYLCKVVTAGSKEARELEKVKKVFEDAYRANGKAKGKTQYSVSDKNIKDMSTGYASGETYFTMSYTQDGKVVATLDYGEYDGSPNVKMIEVDPEYRRKGIGTKLMQELQNKYPDTEINFGMATTDGMKLLDSITYDVTDEAVVADRQKLKDLQAELSELQEKLDVLFDTENLTEEQHVELEKLGDRWQEVYESINKLDKDLRGKKATRTFVKTDAKYSLSDSTGKELTKEQQEYFKDSKVRDENGNLMVMYHGSQDAGFHVFDNKFSDDDTSFFFVDRNDVAASYSGTTETYEAKTIRTAEDMNNFLAEIGYDHYEAVEKNGKIELLENNEHVAWSDTAQGIYEEFCWYEGVGEGDANYKVYLNLTNPLEVDAQGRNWNNVSREYSQEIADRYKSLTAEEKAALHDVASWGEISIFRDAKKNPTDAVMESAFAKIGDVNIYDLFSIAEDNFSDLSIEAWAVEQMNTRDYAKRAKEQGYDGVIFKNIVDNGAYSNGSEGASTVAIAFDSNQIKSVANETPTKDADIRYSLIEEVTDEQNERGLDHRSEILYSLSKDTEYMDNAIAKNNTSLLVSYDDMRKAKAMRERIANRMNDIKDRGLVGLPEDREGNTYIANSSYDGTEENTTICPRSLASEAFTDAVSEYLGRPLSVEEQIYISQDLQGRSLTPECTYCYVATDRKAYRAFLGEYVSQRDAVLQKVQDNPNADVSRSGELYKEFLNGRKDTNPMYSRFKMWVDAYKNGKPMIDASHLANINKLMGDIKSEFGAELKPQIVDAMKYAQSASWAKKRVSYVAYNGHILKWKQDRINKLNSHYGLRMYSFSDFHPAFVLENMQMITDASVRGLKMLGYTKDTDFVDIFAPSGMNINVSTFGFESGGNVYENNLIGAEWEKAKALREQYPNVGITFVATNDTLVNWALEQDWIDVVIPYHLVRTGAEVAKAFGYTNYTSESSDVKTKEWAKGDKKYIAPTEHNNDKATYLAALEKNHLKPRFERFIENPNYMKLVNECRQPASVSKPVQPIFNEDAAMVALAKLEANGYYQPIGGSVDRMYEIAAEVAEDMQSQLAPAMSLSNVGEAPKRYGTSATPAKDLRLEIAPVAEKATPAVTADKTATAEEMFPDEPDTTQAEYDNLLEVKEALENRMSELAESADFNDPAIISEFEKVNAEWVESSSRILELEEQMSKADADRLDSLSDADAPPEMDAPYYGESNRESVSNPFENRDWYEVGKDRKTQAFMRENPEFKPFFQEEAMNMLYDLSDTMKAERWYNDELHYESGGELGFGGNKRHTSQDIAQILDEWHLTYDQIEEGLTAIIEDNDKVNNMPAKRIEFKLNERLMRGYKDFHTNKMVEPNEAYLEMLREWQVNQQSKASFDSFMETADQYAPEDIAPIENIAPVAPVTQVAPVAKETTVPVKPAPKAPVKPAPKKAEKQAATPSGHVARIIAEEPDTAKRASKAWTWAKEHLLDNGMVFEDLSKATGNRKLEAKWNFIRNSGARAQRLIGKGTDKVKSLKDIRKQVEKSGKTEKFYEYLYHKHNVSRMTLADRFEGVPNKAVFGDSITADISKTEAAKLLKQNPEFKQWSQDVYKYNKHLRKLLVDGGVISQEVANLWEKMYPHYVPIRRDGDTGLNINVPLDTRKTGVNAPIKRATGGSRDILPLFDTMAMRTEQTYRAIAKNNFGIELKNILGSTISNEAQTVDGVIDSLDSDEALLKKGENGMNPTFTVFENGERVEFEITDEMYEAMKPKSDIMSYNNKVLNGISNFRRGTLTEYNPWFLLKNAIKDQQDVIINSQHPIKTYANMPVAIGEMVANGKYYREYLENGGEQNTYFDNETNTFKDNKAWEAVKWATGLNEIAWANNKIEMLPRLAEYIASRKAGRSVEVSMLDAARVTTNFAAGGDVTKLVNRNGATFLNASVQGAVQQARNIREAKMNGLKGWAGLAARYLVAGLPVVLLNNLIWEDDEEYEKLADYVKRDYYIVGKFDDGKFVRIPKGRTVAVIQNAFEQMDNLRTGDDELDLKSFLDLAVSNLAPNNPLENNVLSPIIQVRNNKTWYGEDLVPARLQDLPAEEQYDESTDDISRWLGEKLDYSPVKINYLLDQYSGVLGDTFLPMLTPKAESGDDTTMGTMTAPLRDMFTTDSVINNQITGDFYDTKDLIDMTANSSKATEEDMMKSTYMQAVSWELSDLYKQKREIQTSNLADSAKYKQSRDIQKQINEIMENAMGGYNDVSITGLYSEVGDKRFNMDAESGKWYEIKAKNADGSDNWYYQKEQEVTKGLGIGYEEYWNNREEYNYAYDNPEKYTVAKAVGGYSAFRGYTSDLWDIKADKDKNGKSISGSRKEKVIDYINNMDADYGEKIILFKSEYPADDTYNYDIVEYLNGRDDISYDEMVTILKYLDFKVDSKGNVKW